MAVRKRAPAKRKTTTVRKKPASPAAQRKATVPSTGLRKKPTRVRKAPPKTGVKKPTPKVKKSTPKQLNKSLKTAPKKIKPKGRLGALIAGGATLIGGLSALRNKPKTFGEKFKQERRKQGTDGVFTYKGKKYSTVTKDDLKRAGYTNLRDYLNAQKKKGSSSSRNRRTR